MATQEPLTEIAPAEFGKQVGPLLGGLFVFYLAASSSFVGELASCELRQAVSSNPAIKHILGLMTMFFFIHIASRDIRWNKGILAGVVFGLYALFVLGSRSHPTFQLTSVVVLFVIFMLQIGREEQVATVDTQTNDEDKADQQAVVDRIITAQWGLGAVVIVMTVVGFMVFVGQKRIELGPSFSLGQLFADTYCQHAGRPGVVDSLKAFFGVTPSSPTKRAQRQQQPAVQQQPTVQQLAVQEPAVQPLAMQQAKPDVFDFDELNDSSTSSM